MNLTLPYPPSANRYWRQWQGRMVVSSEARQYKETVGWLVKADTSDWLTGPVALTIKVYRPQKRGDLDNCLKILLDSLKGVLFADDDQVVEIHAYRGDDKANPRVEMKVSEL